MEILLSLISKLMMSIRGVSVFSVGILFVGILHVFKGYGYSAMMNEDSAGWNLRKDKDGIQVYTRDTEEKGMLEYRAITTIETSLERLIEIIHDVENYPVWTANCDSAVIYEVVNDSVRIEYMTTPVPWPLSDRDVVMEFVVTKQTNDYFEARLTSVPDAIPLKENYIRMKESKGFWIFRRIDVHQVEVIHQFYGDPEGNIPTWIVNLFIVSGPFKTLENLKELSNNP
jgi:ribosome-associated toxin RatA of RatAB toxin-antitoxin module